MRCYSNWPSGIARHIYRRKWREDEEASRGVEDLSNYDFAKLHSVLSPIFPAGFHSLLFYFSFFSDPFHCPCRVESNTVSRGPRRRSGSSRFFYIPSRAVVMSNISRTIWDPNTLVSFHSSPHVCVSVQLYILQAHGITYLRFPAYVFYGMTSKERELRGRTSSPLVTFLKLISDG